MFSGIVEEVGRVHSSVPFENGVRLTLNARLVLDGLAAGDSMAIDGVCQTVVSTAENEFTVQAIATTLARTTFSRLQPGDEVNLERALAFGARVGGHLVQGHVDGIGRIAGVRRAGEHTLLDVTMPDIVAEVTTLHGSITVNGVSLTVNALPRPDIVQVALIPYTLEHTALRRLQPGREVNLEGDMLGKFVVHWLKRRNASGV